MTEATAGHVVDLLEASAEGREHYARAADVADELGIRGILTRMVGSLMPPVSEGERVYALLWDETLLEARADVEEELGMGANAAAGISSASGPRAGAGAGQCAPRTSSGRGSRVALVGRRVGGRGAQRTRVRGRTLFT